MERLCVLIFILVFSVHDKNAQSLKGRGLGDK